MMEVVSGALLRDRFNLQLASFPASSFDLIRGNHMTANSLPNAANNARCRLGHCVAVCPSQEDLFIPTLTPREHLRFHANMRMSASLSKEEKMQAVESSLADLGLGERG